MEIVYKLLVITVALSGFFTGLKRGMLRQMMSLLGVAFAIVSCRVLTPSVADVLQTKIPFWCNHFAPQIVYSVLASTLIFGIVYICFALMDVILHNIMGKWEIGGLDLVLGAVYRVFRNLLLLSVIYNVIAVVDCSSSLVKEERGADGNLIEIIMPLAPSMLNNGYDNFGHLLQLEEAKKIS